MIQQDCRGIYVLKYYCFTCGRIETFLISQCSLLIVFNTFTIRFVFMFNYVLALYPTIFLLIIFFRSSLSFFPFFFFSLSLSFPFYLLYLLYCLFTFHISIYIFIHQYAFQDAFQVIFLTVCLCLSVCQQESAEKFIDCPRYSHGMGSCPLC